MHPVLLVEEHTPSTVSKAYSAVCLFASEFRVSNGENENGKDPDDVSIQVST
jgi:hypothetical protein